MKKIKMFFVLGIVAISITACKKEVIVNPPATTTNETTNVVEDVNVSNTSVDVKDLPSNAITFVQENFSDTNIASYEIKNIPVVGKGYEVKLNNGVEVGFDENGNWHEIQDARGIHANLLPSEIKSYVDQNYKGTFVTSIEKEKNEIKVDLANDIDLIFDSAGKFLKIDK